MFNLLPLPSVFTCLRENCGVLLCSVVVSGTHSSIFYLTDAEAFSLRFHRPYSYDMSRSVPSAFSSGQINGLPGDPIPLPAMRAAYSILVRGAVVTDVLRRRIGGRNDEGTSRKVSNGSAGDELFCKSSDGGRARRKDWRKCTVRGVR